MADLHDQLNRVLKYGRIRPVEDWGPHVNEMYEQRRGKSGPHVGDVTRDARLILADKFGDEGDPREHILRAVGQRVAGIRPLYVGTEQQAHRVELADGSSLTGSIQRQDGDTPTHVRLHWFGQTPEGAFIGFGADLNPEHARHIVSQFHPDDATGIENLVKLIDTHFPPTSA